MHFSIVERGDLNYSIVEGANPNVSTRWRRSKGLFSTAFGLGPIVPWAGLAWIESSWAVPGLAMRLMGWHGTARFINFLTVQGHTL